MLEDVSNRHGTYARVFRCRTPVEAAEGKLGPALFHTGYWIHMGSADSAVLWAFVRIP